MKAMREDLQRDSDELDAEMQKYKEEAEQMEEDGKEPGEEISEEEILATGLRATTAEPGRSIM